MIASGMLAGGEVEAFTARRPDDHRVVMRFEEDAQRARSGASSSITRACSRRAVLDVEREHHPGTPPGVSSIRSSPPMASYARDRETEPDPATARAVAEALERFEELDARSARWIWSRSITRTMT